MRKFLVRMTCEYTLVVEAETRAAALDAAELTPSTAWDPSWSEVDCDDDEEA